jgi:RNA polymerase sigma factor (TIGR02999 family)
LVAFTGEGKCSWVYFAGIECRNTARDVSDFESPGYGLSSKDQGLEVLLMTTEVSLTRQLQLFFEGDQAGADALMREIMPKLHEMASQKLSREARNPPLSPTELIQELWLRNLSKARWQIHNQGHFYAIVSLAMRRVLIDFARRRLAERRSGEEEALSLSNVEPVTGGNANPQQIIEIGIIMERLDDVDSDAARIVDMHYFGGFTLQEIAESTKLTFRQVRSRWERGLKFLRKSMKADAAGA